MIDTGSSSVHIGKGDKSDIEDIGWENIGVSKIFSRGIKAAKAAQSTVRVFREFKDGRAGMDELIRELNKLEKAV